MTQTELPPGHPEIGQPAPQFTWKTPDGWQELAASEFRVASFKITGQDGQQADVSVIPLPGMAGGDLSNVNRWRGQVGQPPVSEEQLKTLAENIDVGGQPAALYDQVGDSMRILAVIQHRKGTAWFIKMTGDNQLVTQHKPVFVEFLKSLQFTTAHAGRPHWTAPPDWKEVPGGQFLVAKFMIGTEASVNISTSPGNGGGLAANVNRWRKQLGLSELADEELAQSVKSTGPVTLVEMSGQSASLVAAIVSQPGQTWFYKLMGDATVVAAQKDAFTKFVQEVKY